VDLDRAHHRSGAVVIDEGECRKGNQVACVATGLGAAGVIAGAPVVIGDLFAISPISNTGTALRIVSSAGLVYGGASLAIDYGRAVAGGGGGCP
jgi:hypothetical protein